MLAPPRRAPRSPRRPVGLPRHRRFWGVERGRHADPGSAARGDPSLSPEGGRAFSEGALSAWKWRKVSVVPRGRLAVVSRSFWEGGAGTGAGTPLPFPWNFLPGTSAPGSRPLPLPRWPFPPFLLSFFFSLPARPAAGLARAPGAGLRLGFPAAARGRAPWRAHLGLRTIWRSLCSKPTRACAQTLPFYPRKIIVSSFKINTRLAISTFFPNIIRRGARARTGPAPRGPEHSCRGPARPGPGAATRGCCASALGPPAEPGVAPSAERLRPRGRAAYRGHLGSDAGSGRAPASPGPGSARGRAAAAAAFGSRQAAALAAALPQFFGRSAP